MKNDKAGSNLSASDVNYLFNTAPMRIARETAVSPSRERLAVIWLVVCLYVKPGQKADGRETSNGSTNVVPKEIQRLS